MTARVRPFLRGPGCLLGLLLATVLASCGFQAETAGPSEFAAGLSYTSYVVPKVPWSIHLVRISRSQHDFEFHSTHAHSAALGLGTLTDQIKALPPEMGTPLAGVNGDFFVIEKEYNGDPRGLQLLEGELLSAPIGGVSFWMDAAGVPRLTNVASLFKVTWPNGVTTPFGLNEERRTNNTMVLYTPLLGPSTRTTNGLELVLEPAGEGPWLPLRAGTTYTARVREVRTAPNTPLSSNIMVLSIGEKLRQTVPEVEAGAVLKISTETSPDLQGVKTAISGGPLLVHKGQRQSWAAPAGDGPLPWALRSMNERHPRSAFGWDERFFYLIQVDGRQKGWSAGMTLKELADFMIDLGCQEAINFDGGRSAEVWCNGRIVNSPCDKREREIANALIVVRKPRPQESTTVSGFQAEGKLAP